MIWGQGSEGIDRRAAEAALIQAVGPGGLVIGPFQGIEALTRYAVDDLLPGWVVRPLGAESAAAVVQTADRLGLAVVPRGGGTQMAWGRVPERVDVVLDLSALNQAVDVQPGDMTITVEAGMPVEQLQAILAEQGQFLPIDAPLLPGATIGGLIATNASGPLRFGYGTVRDYLIGVRVIRANGEITKGGGRVVKNVAGYELCKLYTGSFGTLGVIVEATFKVRPRPEAFALVGLPAGIDEAEAAIAALMDSDVEAHALLLLDHMSLQLEPFAPLAARIPSRKNPFLLLAGFTGAPATVDWQTRRAAEALRADPIRLDWEPTMAAVREGLRPGLAGAITCRASVLSSRTVEFCREANRIAARCGMPAACVAQAGNGDVTIHMWASPEMDLAAAKAIRALAAEAARPATGAERLGPEPVPAAAGFDASLLGQGNCVVQAAPAAVRREAPVFGQPRPDQFLMTAIKAKLDPKHTLNRGRFIDGT